MAIHVHQTCWNSFSIWTRFCFHHSQKHKSRVGITYILRFLSLAQTLVLILQSVEFENYDREFMLQSLFKHFNSIAGFQKIMKLLETPASFNIFSSIMVLYFLFLIMLLIIIFSLSYKQPEISRSVKFASNLTTLHTEILCYPISIALFTVLEAAIENKFNLLINREICIVIFIMLSAFNAAITLFKIVLCYSSVKSGHLINQKGNLHLIGIAILKLALPPLHLPSLRRTPQNQASCEIASVIMSFITSFYVWFYSLTKLPDYDLKIMKLQIIFNSMFLGVTSSQLITIIFKDQGIIFSLFLIVFPLWIKLNLNIFKKLLKRLSFHFESSKNPYFLAHFEMIQAGIDQNASFTYKIPVFSEETLHGHWLISKRNEGGSFNNFNTNKILGPENDIILFLKKQYGIFQANKTLSPLASLAYARLILKYFQMIPKAYSLCYPILHKKWGIQNKLAAFDIICKIQKILNKGMEQQAEENSAYKGAWDMFLAESAFDEFKSEISKYTQIAIDYWSLLKVDTPDILSLVKKAKNLNRQGLVLESRWQKHEPKFYKHLPLAFLLYGLKQAQFSNRPWEGTEKIKKYNELFFNRPIRTNMPNSSPGLSSVVILSCDKKAVGIVLKVSEDFYKVFGVEKKMIIGHSVNRIMTRFIAERHNGFLMNYLETGEEKVIGKETKQYAKDANNNIFPIRFTVVLQPNKDQGIVLSALIKKIDSQDEYILYNEDGTIEDMSKKIRILIDIESNKKIHVQSLFLEPISKDNQPYSATFLGKADSNSIPINCKVQIDSFCYGSIQNVMAISFNDSSVNNIIDDRKEDLKEDEDTPQLNIKRYAEPTRATKKIFNKTSLSNISTKMKKPKKDEEPRNITIEAPLMEQKFVTDTSVGIQNVLESEASSYQISLISQNKITDHIQDMFEKSYSQKSRRIITSIFTLLMLINIVIFTVQFLTFKGSINDIKLAGDIVGASYERLNALSWIYKYAIRYQAVVSNIATVTPAELDRYKLLIRSNREVIKTANNKLANSISTTVESEQRAFYQKQVELIYDNATNNLQGRKISSFEAINVFIDNLMNFDMTPHSVLIETGNPDLEFVRKNAANSLLISSEKTIQATKKNLFEKSASKQAVLMTVFYLNIPVAVIGILIVVIISKKTVKNMNKLSQAMLIIPQKDIEKIISKLEAFNKTVKSKEKLAKQKLYAPPAKKEGINTRKKNSHLSEKEFKIKRFLSIKVREILLVAFLLSSFLIISFLNYNDASNVFNDLLAFDNKFFVAWKARFAINTASATVYDLVVFRNTTKIRNESVDKQLVRNLDDIISSEIMYKEFSNANEGFIDPSLETLFRGKPCSLVVNYPGSNNLINCPLATKNESLEIFSVNSQYPIELTYLGNTMLSDLSLSNSQVMYSKMVSIIDHKTSTLIGALIYVTELLQQILKQRIDYILTESPIRFALEAILLSIFGVLTVLFVYKRMLDDSAIRLVLKAVPHDEVVKNRLLQKLIKNLYSQNQELIDIGNQLSLQ